MHSCKRDTLVVDFLNFGLWPIIRKLNPKRQTLLIYLFPNNYFTELLVKLILTSKNIQYKFIPFNSKETYKTQSNISDEITSKFIKSCNLNKLNAGNYLDIIIGNIFYKKIYKVVAPNVFVESLNLKNPSIYFNYSNVRKHIEKIYKFKNLNYYNALGNITPQNYMFDYNQNSRIWLHCILTMLKFTYVLFRSFINSLPKELKFKPLFYIHKADNSFLKNISYKLEKTNYSYLVFLEPFKIKYKNKKYDIRCLRLSELFLVITQFIGLIKELKSKNFLNIYDKINLLKEFFNIFFVDKFLREMTPPLFYSRYESTMCQLFQVLCKNYNCVTLASVLSYGYFPQKYEGGHQTKFCDVFFVWGKKHSDLILHSEDKSEFHIVSGYGEITNGNESEKSEVKKYADYKKLICFCDNTFYEDLYLNKKDTFRILKIWLEIAKKSNYKFVIKTKKYKNIYEDLMKENSSVIVDIDDKLGSINQYHRNTIFLGYSLFSLGVLALKQNKIAIFFDKYNMIWDNISSYLTNFIIKNETDLLEKIKNQTKLNINKNKKIISKIIDLDEVDGNEKIADYIIFYLNNISLSKNITINKANQFYANKWGKENLIINKKISNYKFN